LGSGSLTTSLAACNVTLASVIVAPVWQVAHCPAPSNTTFPLAADTGSKLPAEGSLS
jgi:hypothetical protein